MSADALLCLKRRQQAAFPFHYSKAATDGDENESAVYADREPWSPCFCPRCNRKLPFIEGRAD